jgi:hypothetical protein
MTSTPIILSTRSRGPVEQFSRFEFDSDVWTCLVYCDRASRVQFTKFVSCNDC